MLSPACVSLSQVDANIASNVTHKFMRRNDGMFPFYREALADTLYLKDELNTTLGGFIRQEFALWRNCDDPTSVSQEVIRRVWRRLG